MLLIFAGRVIYTKASELSLLYDSIGIISRVANPPVLLKKQSFLMTRFKEHRVRQSSNISSSYDRPTSQCQNHFFLVIPQVPSILYLSPNDALSFVCK